MHDLTRNQPTRAKVVNFAELVRFLFSGVAAAASNIAAAWLARRIMAFEGALVVGIIIGLLVSLGLSKWFAFGARSWSRTGHEATRFLIVYALGSGIYWLVAVSDGRLLHSNGVSSNQADFAGIIVGALVMAITSYLGHRFFTYRSHLEDHRE